MMVCVVRLALSVSAVHLAQCQGYLSLSLPTPPFPPLSLSLPRKARNLLPLASLSLSKGS